MTVTTKHNPMRAIVFALIGYSCWVFGDMFMKLAVETGAPRHEIMFFGGLSGMLMILLVTLARRRVKVLQPRAYGGLALLAVMFLFNYMCWQIALSHLPLANFYAIPFMAPTAVVILSGVILGEQLDWRKIAVTVTGFIGVLIVVNPMHVFQDKGSWAGYAAAACGMCVLVVQQLTMRFIATRESREATAFYPRLGAVVGGLVGMAAFGFEPMTAKGFLYCLGTGSIGGIGWMMMAQAYKMAPVSTVAPFHYSEIITSVLIGYLVWHDVPSLNFAVGAFVIILSGLYVLRHAHKATQAAVKLEDNP